MGILSRLSNTVIVQAARNTAIESMQRVLAASGPLRPKIIETVDTTVNTIRRFRATSPQPRSRTRWEPGDEERALQAADSSGNLEMAAKLVEAMLGDATVAGVLAPKTVGLVRLPLDFNGVSQTLIDELKGTEEDPGSGLFWRFFPERELVKIQTWGEMLGIGIAEWIMDEEGNLSLHTLEPQFLQYRWTESQWYYQTQSEGLVKVCPGDGRWVLYTPYGAERPWLYGKWRPIASPFIQKQLAYLDRGRWSERMASGILWAGFPNTSTQRQREGWVDEMIEGLGTPIMGMQEGGTLNLLESSGKGFEVWSAMIKECDEQIIIALASQTVTTTGTTGFGDGNIHERTASSLLQASADNLAECLRTQGLCRWAEYRFYDSDEAPWIRWDATPPDDSESKAKAATAMADAATKWETALSGTEKAVDMVALAESLQIPLKDNKTAPIAPLAPTGLPQSIETEMLDEPTPDHGALLADEMTQHGMEQCEHGKKNRCRLCGVERSRGIEKDAQGNQKWKVAWRPLVEAPNAK